MWINNKKSTKPIYIVHVQIQIHIYEMYTRFQLWQGGSLAEGAHIACHDNNLNS